MGCGRARVRVPRARRVCIVYISTTLRLTLPITRKPAHTGILKIVPRYPPSSHVIACDSPEESWKVGNLLSNLVGPCQVIYYPHAIGFYAHSRDEINRDPGDRDTRPHETHTLTRTGSRGHPTHDTTRSPQTHPRAPDPDAQTPSRVRAPIPSSADCALAPPGLAGLFAMPLGSSMGPSS